MTSRILYVTHRVPWPPDRGDRIRTWNILKFLSRHSVVDLACLSDEAVSDETVAALRKVTGQLAIVPHCGAGRYLSGLKSLICGRTITEGMFASAELQHLLRTWAQHHRWDAAITSSSGIAAMTDSSVIGDIARRWVDLIDVDSEKWLDYSRSTGFLKSMLFGIEARRLRAVEKQLAADCERLLVVSDAEVELFRSFCSSDRIMAVANGVDTEYFAARPVNEDQIPSCVFVGVMNYLPNVDAVCWFASEVWPSVRRSFPNATFRIVGKSPSAEVRALEAVPGIEVIGSVPDVRPWLYSSTCAVIPLRIARGIQNKVLEAMACGRPVICSSSPLKGIAAEPGLHLLRADSAEEWAAAVGRVFRDRCLQQELGLAAETWVRRHHCWDASLTPLLSLTAPTSDQRPAVISEKRPGVSVEVGR